MMLSTQRSTANTAESWFNSVDSSRPSSQHMMTNGTLEDTVFPLFSDKEGGLEIVEERSDEDENGKLRNKVT